MAWAVTAVLPTRAEAQAVCNAQLGLSYTAAHAVLLPPESVTVNAQLTTGTITGGVGGNFADLNRVRFQLDCDPANGLFVGCPNVAPGNEVSYDGDTHISVSGTCVDQNGNPVTMKSSLPGGGSGSVNNQVVFTFFNQAGTIPTPVRLAANDSTGCTFSFQITVLSHDDDATLIRELIDEMFACAEKGDTARVDEIQSELRDVIGRRAPSKSTIRDLRR